jgi:3-dehydroquinate dehydratase-1
MKIKICTPVIGKTTHEFLRNLERIQKMSSFVELRVDLISDLKVNDLDLIGKKIYRESIITVRSKKLFLSALRIRPDYIDIDYDTIVKEKIVLPENKNSKLIISFHDFEKTPTKNQLMKILKDISVHRPDIIKLATMIKKRKDVDNLFKILIDMKSRQKLIVVGMGEKGKMTRIIAPLLGSYLTYASTELGKTAPGQIDLMKMKEIYRILNR